MTAAPGAQNHAGVWTAKLGFGRKTALLVIDLLQAYTLKGAPLFAQGVVEAVREMPALLALSRAKKMPIVHTRVLYNPSTFADGGVWILKAPVLKSLVPGSKYARFSKGVEPQRRELVVVKNYSSAFSHTSLAATLTAMGVDTVLITGCTTSGCVRASAVDAVQNGFRPLVIRECVGDRHPDPHAASLFDINAKYGDVITKAEAMQHISQLRRSAAASKRGD